MDGQSAITAEYGFVPASCARLSARSAKTPSRLRRQRAPFRVHHVPVVATVFTSMFLHAGWAHLGFNMLFLWVFGSKVEDRLGRVRFLAFYLLGGVAALGLQWVADPGSAVATIGASGAIAAVLAGYLLLYPRALILTLVGWIPIPLPAVLFLLIWILLQLAGRPVRSGRRPAATASPTWRTWAGSRSGCWRSGGVRSGPAARGPALAGGATPNACIVSTTRSGAARRWGAGGGGQVARVVAAAPPSTDTVCS